MSNEREPIEAVFVDTLSGILDKIHVKDKMKSSFDKWKEYAFDVLSFLDFITDEMEWQITLVIGREGSGKTCGIRTLDPNTTVLFNCDKKPLTFVKDGKVGNYYYNKDSKPSNYYTPSNLDEIKRTMKAMKSKGHNPHVFILGHPEIYKDVNESASQRLRVLGKAAHKHNLEGRVVTCLYTHVDPSLDVNDPNRWCFITQNNGSNSARSMMGMFPPLIPNDFQYVLDVLNGKRKGDELPEGFTLGQ